MCAHCAVACACGCLAPQRYPGADPRGIDLLSKLLVFHPSKRISVEECLKHPFLADVRSADTEVGSPGRSAGMRRGKQGCCAS